MEEKHKKHIRSGAGVRTSSSVWNGTVSHPVIKQREMPATTLGGGIISGPPIIAPKPETTLGGGIIPKSSVSDIENTKSHFSTQTELDNHAQSQSQKKQKELDEVKKIDEDPIVNEADILSYELEKAFETKEDADNLIELEDEIKDDITPTKREGTTKKNRDSAKELDNITNAEIEDLMTELEKQEELDQEESRQNESKGFLKGLIRHKNAK